MKHKFSTWIFLALIGLAFALSSCSKDKDLDDYRNEKLQSDLAEYKAVEGSYTGYLVSSRNENVNLGALEINLEAKIETDNNSGDSRAQARPALMARVIYHGEYESSLVGQNSVYEPNSGIFHSEIEITITNGVGNQVKELIRIDGSVGSGTLIGTMATTSDTKSGGKFTLKMNNPSLQDLTSQRKPDIGSTRVSVQKTYFGVVTDGPENVKNTGVRLFVNNPVRDEFNELYYILRPITETSLIVSLSLKDGYVPGATFISIWNNSVATLRGTTTIASIQAILDLTCKRFHFEDKNYNFECEFNSSILGQKILMTFTPPQKQK